MKYLLSFILVLLGVGSLPAQTFNVTHQGGVLRSPTNFLAINGIVTTNTLPTGLVTTNSLPGMTNSWRTDATNAANTSGSINGTSQTNVAVYGLTGSAWTNSGHIATATLSSSGNVVVGGSTTTETGLVKGSLSVSNNTGYGFPSSGALRFPYGSKIQWATTGGALGGNILDANNTLSFGLEASPYTFMTLNSTRLFLENNMVVKGNITASNGVFGGHPTIGTFAHTNDSLFISNAVTGKTLSYTNGSLTADLGGSSVTSGPRNLPPLFRSLTNGMREINVRDFGTDAANDDTDIIQWCVNQTTNYSGIVRIPAGTYVITRPIKIPTTGSTPTNVVQILGDGGVGAVTFIDATTITNGNAFECIAEGNTLAQSSVHFKIRGIAINGPFYKTSFGFDQFAHRFADAASVPFRGAGIFLGKDGLWDADGDGSGPGNRENGFLTEIEDMRLAGFYHGISISNVVSVTIRGCWLFRNAHAMLNASHTDTLRVEGGHWATPLITNAWNVADMGFVMRFVGTGFNDGNGAGDSGVHKTIIGLEAHGPLMYADATRITVIGGQFEPNYNTQSNGWCHFTNWGHYTFIGSSITTPLSDSVDEFGTTLRGTNNIVFACRNDGCASLSLINCKGPGGKDNSPLLYQLPRMFDIQGTNFVAPYWDFGTRDNFAGQNQDTWLNTRYNVTNYLHVKRGGADSLNISAFRKNGRRFTQLRWIDCTDGSNNPITGTAAGNRPARLGWNGYFNDANDHFLGFGVIWTTTVTGSAFTYFPPFYPTPNEDGRMPQYFRVTFKAIATNTFTTTIDSLFSSQTNSVSRYISGTAALNYTSVTTNWQEVVGNIYNFGAPVTGPVVLRLSPLSAVTNGFILSDPVVEYW